MKFEQRDPKSLRACEDNARTHSADQVRQLMGSIRDFGFNNPVLVDRDGEIIAGHGRVQAAIKLKLPSVPVVVLEHLNPQQKKAFALADNRIALNSGWDESRLQALFEQLEPDFPDFGALGFEDAEIDRIFGEYSGDEMETVLDGGQSPLLSDELEPAPGPESDDQGAGNDSEPEKPVNQPEGIRIPLFLNLAPALMDEWKQWKKDCGESDKESAFALLLQTVRGEQ